jgi:hypothetical protein
MIRLRLLWLHISLGLLTIPLPSQVDGQTQTSPVRVESTSPPEIFLFLLDSSGSMNDPSPVTVQTELTRRSKLEEVKDRLKKLIHHLPENARLMISTFDHERKEVFDSVIGPSNHREELLKKIDTSITSRNGSTHLWSSADAELARAQQLIQQGSSRVRLIILSDGEDMEKNPRYTHAKLIEKYSSLIQKELTIDWVTIGFDLAANIKHDFQDAGIRVVKAVDAEDLSPIRAGLQISKREVQINEEVEFIPTTSGRLVAAILDMNDGKVLQIDPKESSKRLTHRFRNPGSYRVAFTVIARDGRKEYASETVRVTSLPWDAPKIQMEPAEVVLGTPVVCTADTNNNGLQIEWRMPDGTTKRGSSIQWLPKKTGEAAITLVATDLEGLSKTSRKSLNVRKPPLPRLQIIGAEQVEFRSPIQLHVSPAVENLSYHWLVEDHPEFHCDEGKLSFNPPEPGSYTFTLQVKDQHAQSINLKHVVQVAVPEIPPPSFDLITEGELRPGGTLRASVLNRHEDVVQHQWRVNGALISEETALTFPIEEYGDLNFELTVHDRFGQSRKESRSIHVPLPPAPNSAFIIAAEKLIEGNDIVVTDSSTGVYHSVRYELTTEPKGIVAQSSVDGRITRFSTKQPGKVAITQITEGPGGINRSSQNIEIERRWIPVEAKFDQATVQGVSPLEITLLNKSSGDFEYGELDPGDGTQKIRFTDKMNLKYIYRRSGTFYPIIALYAPKESKLPPQIWRGKTVQVSAPTPLWVKNLLWQIPLLLGTSFGTWLGISSVNRRREAHRASYIHGELVLIPKDNPLARISYLCDGSQPSYLFSLEDGTQLHLSSFEGIDQEKSYEVILENDEGESRHTILANEPVELDKYTLCFETTSA